LNNDNTIDYYETICHPNPYPLVAAVKVVAVVVTAVVLIPHDHIVARAIVVATVIPVAGVVVTAAVAVSLLPLSLYLPPPWPQPLFVLPWMPMLSSQPNDSATSIGLPTVARDVRTVAISANV
jgi:hypothetical protein